MSLPTRGETFARLLEHIRKAQEEAATMAHLTADEDATHSQGWLAVSEMFKRTASQVTKLATRRMQ